MASEGDQPQLSPGFEWCWRFTWDAVHGKLTSRKPYLITDTDLKMEKNKPIAVTKGAQ